MYLMLSIMIGGMYYDIDNDQTTVQDRISILFLRGRVHGLHGNRGHSKLYAPRTLFRIFGNILYS